MYTAHTITCLIIKSAMGPHCGAFTLKIAELHCNLPLCDSSPPLAIQVLVVLIKIYLNLQIIQLAAHCHCGVGSLK